jgi:hypothetical protein
MRVRHKETGEILRIRLGHPMPGGELQSDIQSFVLRDGRLVLLASAPANARRPPSSAPSPGGR